MKFPIFASFIVFVVWLTYELKKHYTIESKGSENFWDREAKANSTRKQSLASLHYIQIPYESLPLSLLVENEIVKEYQELLFSLKDKKIVNLTGISNTELKLQYGAPNLPSLTEFDQNYTLLARTLYRLSECYCENGYRNEAVTLLEFAVSTTTDVSGTYHLLASIYKDNGEMEKIDFLLTQANKINGMMKNSIVRTLQKFYPDND